MPDNPTRNHVPREILQSYGEPPLPTSSLYSHRSKRVREDGVEQHVIVGVHVIFKPKHPNGLYEAFNVSRSQKLDAGNPSVATRALGIACDTLEIFGELSLPECEVAIYARRLVFRDQGNINTTPLDWTMVGPQASTRLKGMAALKEQRGGLRAASICLLTSSMRPRKSQ
jgi:hypothetical protein